MPGALVKHVGSVESTTRAHTHTLVVPAGGVAAGNTILLGFTTNDWINRVIEVDDDRGNTWAEDIRDATESGTYKVCSRIFHCHVTTALQAGDEITISIDPTGDPKSCAAWADEFSGILTLAALDQTGAGHGGSTEPASELVTTLHADEVVWGVIGCNGPATIEYTASDWVERTQVGSTVDDDRQTRCAYKILTAEGVHGSAGTIAFLTSPQRWVALIATYKATAAGGGPTITTSSLDEAAVGEVYAEQLEATGGTPPLSWSIIAGTLPAGLSLAAATGAIAGTPTTVGAASFTARATDDVALTDEQDLSITVAVAPWTSARRASYEARVGWEKTVVGGFTIGVSLIGGEDGIGGSAYSSDFIGPEDDISRDLRAFTLRLGRDDHDQPMREGSASLTLRDEYDNGAKNGKYNPKNEDSPLAGKLLPLRPVRLSATLDSAHAVFFGFTRTGEARPGPRRGTAQLELVDLFVWLERAHPIISATGQTTTGTAIGLILDAARWTEPAMRRLAVGDTIPDFSSDGSDTALALIARLLETERGVFFIDKDGVAVYEERNAWALKTKRAAIISEMRALGPGFSLDIVRNRARVTREGGVQQEYVGQASADEFGFADHSEITTPYLASDEQALNLATYLVNRTKDPIGPLWQLEIDARSPELLDAILTIRPQDWIEVVQAPSGTAGDYIVEQIVEELDERGLHKATYTLSERPVSRPFTIGTSVIGGLDVLIY